MIEVTVLCQSVAVSRSEVQWSCMMLFTGVSEDSIPHNLTDKKEDLQILTREAILEEESDEF